MEGLVMLDFYKDKKVFITGHLPELAENSKPSWFGFLVSVKPESGLKRNDVTKYIESKNVQTRLLFSSNLIKNPCFNQIRGTDAYRVVDCLEVKDFVMNNSFWGWCLSRHDKRNN